MLVPRCLKQALSELQPFKAIGNYMGGIAKIAKFQLNQCMCIVLYDSADIQKQNKNNIRSSNKNS